MTQENQDAKIILSNPVTKRQNGYLIMQNCSNMKFRNFEFHIGLLIT